MGVNLRGCPLQAGEDEGVNLIIKRGGSPSRNVKGKGGDPSTKGGVKLKRGGSPPQGEGEEWG